MVQRRHSLFPKDTSVSTDRLQLLIIGKLLDLPDEPALLLITSVPFADHSAPP